ncbi:phosphoribosylglycinamide formyltransferase [Lactobacillus sp. 3B(2020)]|uniref:phosphoribosylglycinamide formyltransferase n=1 Tax=Lactobacillus sp. 3B(2020) TaxID=2695882 RepID=UPI0015E04C27|nr:phosphoribosylglycinamide formyltransferase [Lactobacillus sp. 3B(2020)]QLL70770.1 phosphoribosylglycinamide formyltransferase [Lactobacillus sp. 3B(2020)]
MRVAVLASGNGTNFQVIAEHYQNHDLPGELALLFCNHPTAPVMQRAEKFNVPAEAFTVKDCGSKEAYEARLLKLLQAYQIDFIALAGYLRVVGSTILAAFPNRIVNLHPALLPKYPGLHSIERAFDAGEKETGVTVHYIDAGLDSGPIIAQRAVPILPTDTVESLETRVHEVEHQLYPTVLKQVLTSLEEEN